MKGAQRIIPADIPADLTEQIRQAAMRAFRAIGCAGVARVDFLCRPADGVCYVNEINTMPGSLSFYLWEASGIPFPSLIDRLIAMAQQRAANKRQSTYTFSSSLLGK
jgi:D-alanine-D-alanine ligase